MIYYYNKKYNKKNPDEMIISYGSTKLRCPRCFQKNIYSGFLTDGKRKYKLSAKVPENKRFFICPGCQTIYPNDQVNLILSQENKCQKRHALKEYLEQ